MTSHYDTPGTLTKTSWFVTYCRPFDSLLKVKLVSQTAQHTPKQVQELHASKVKHTQHTTRQAERRENVSNRNEYSHILSIYTNDAKITRYSMSNNKA